MNKLMKAEKKIEDAVVSGYKSIENGVVSGYKKIEDKFVETFLRLMLFLQKTTMIPKQAIHQWTKT